MCIVVGQLQSARSSGPRRSEIYSEAAGDLGRSARASSDTCKTSTHALSPNACASSAETNASARLGSASRDGSQTNIAAIVKAASATTPSPHLTKLFTHPHLIFRNILHSNLLVNVLHCHYSQPISVDLSRIEQTSPLIISLASTRYLSSYANQSIFSVRIAPAKCQSRPSALDPRVQCTRKYIRETEQAACLALNTDSNFLAHTLVSSYV